MFAGVSCYLRAKKAGVVLGAGMVRVMDGPYTGPFNIGNPTEFTMLELAQVPRLQSIRDIFLSLVRVSP